LRFEVRGRTLEVKKRLAVAVGRRVPDLGLVPAPLGGVDVAVAGVEGGVERLAEGSPWRFRAPVPTVAIASPLGRCGMAQSRCRGSGGRR
jgi:hypothetical protein